MVPRLALSVLLLSGCAAGPVAGPSDPTAWRCSRPTTGSTRRCRRRRGAARQHADPAGPATAGAEPPLRRLPDALRRPHLAATAPPVVDGGAAIAPIRCTPGSSPAWRTRRRALAFFAARGSRRAASARRASGGASTSGRSRPRGRSTARPRWRGPRGSPPPTRRPLMRGAALALAAAVAACTAGLPLPPQPRALRGAVPALRRGGAALPEQLVRRGRHHPGAGPGLPRQRGADQQRLPDPLRRPRRPAGALRAAAAVPDRERRAGDPAGAGAPRHRHRDQRRGACHPLSSAASATARAASAPRASDGGSTSDRSPRRAPPTRRWRWRGKPGSSRPTSKYTRF